MDFSEVDPVGRSEEKDFEAALRPKRLSEFEGQPGSAISSAWSWRRPGTGAAARTTCCCPARRDWGKPPWR